MMTTQSSKTKIWLKKLAVMPLLASFIFLFAERVEAQEEIINDYEFEKEKIPENEFVKTGFTLIKDENYYFVTNNNNTRYYNKEGKICDKNGKPLSTIKAKSSTIIPGNFVTKTYYKGKVFCTFKEDSKVKKLQYIDSPIIKNYPGSKQNVSEEIPFMTTTIKPEKEINVGTVTDIHLKLKNVNALKITYFDEDNPKNVKEVTPKEMEIYKTLLAKGKKHNIYKQKDVVTLKDIYSRMSEKQKNTVKSVFDILPPPANMALVSNYLKLFRNLKKSSIIKKENIVDLENMYRQMTETGKEFVFAPHLLIPKPGVSKTNIIRKGFLNINKVTPKEMEVYKTLLAKSKKSNIYKQRDILKMQDIYKRMSKEQKSSVKNVSELIPPPPNASKEGILKAKKAYEKWKKRTGNNDSTSSDSKNIIKIIINKSGKLFVSGKSTSINNLKNTLDNIKIDKKQAIVIIKTDVKSKYSDFIKVKEILRKNKFYKVQNN